MNKILLLLANGFETYEASAFVDVFGWNQTLGDKSTKLVTCGLSSEIRSSFDVIVKPDYLVNEINADDFNALAIPGGFEEYGFYNDAFHKDFLELLHRFHDRGKIIASICVAALALGKSGLLKGKKATMYQGIRQTQLKEFGAKIINEPMVIDDGMITSWNPATAINVALKLLELVTTNENAKNIRNLMGF